MNKKIPGLYIHIPFCDSICSYCDFPKLLSGTNFQDDYLDKLIIKLSDIDQREFETIYIGGGTPSSLNTNQLEKLLKFIAENFSFSDEFSFEANPENLTMDKIHLLKKYRVNRVSLGVQSFNRESLKILNRKHDEFDVFNCVRNLQKAGIANINLDFIFGLKNEGKKEYLKNIAIARNLQVKHISYYSLQIESGTRLYKTPQVRKSDDELAADYEFIVKTLKDYDYNQYEISNFCQSSFKSKHNLIYWNNREYYGEGLGATGLINSHRIVQTRNIKRYIQEEDTIASDTVENESDREFNYLMLNLRLVSGFKLDEFKSLFNRDFLIEYKGEIERVKDSLIVDESSVRVKPEKFFILDSILVDLLHFKENE